MKRAIVLALLVLAFTGCKSRELMSKVVLTSAEKQVCDSLQIDTSLVIQIRKYSNSPIEPFHYSLSKVYSEGIEKEADPIFLQGLVFKEKAGNTEQLLANLHGYFKARGYSLFMLERNFGIKGNLDVMAILPTIDKYEILKQIKTDGINYDIDTDSLIRIIQILDDKYSLDLVGAGGDWCEFIINKEPADWMQIAREAYKVCPDIVEQGTETVEALAKEIKKTKRLYFWWD